MPFEINVAGVDVPTTGAAFKSFQDDLNLVFHLSSALSSLLNGRLDQVPANACSSQVSYASPPISWNPGGGPVQFGFQANASGALQIVPSGELLEYTDGLASPQTVSVTVPAGTVYVKTTLSFAISANAAAAYSGGAYGVKAALDTAESYAVTYCKAFRPDTTVSEALAAALKGFVLPLHKETLTQLEDEDYLLHEFDGNLHLAFGAYAGLDKVLYAGQASVDVIKALGSPLATVSASTCPQIKAGAQFSFSYSYASRFEALLSRGGGAAKMHLFRSSKATVNAGLHAGLTFDGNTTASISVSLDTVGQSLVKAAGGANSPGGAAMGAIMKAGGSEVQKYVAEVNDKLTAWLNKANGLQTNLQVALEASRSRVVLAAYTFDLGSAALQAGWNAAIAGDLPGALATGAVALEPGSGLEKEYQRKTSFQVNLFNLWNFSTWSQYASSVSMVYAGNNVFHLQAQVGRTTETDSMGAMHSMDLYFAASADQGAGGTLANAGVNLHIDLTAQSDPKGAGTIATMLSAMEAGPTADALARDMHAFATRARQGTAQLNITISPKGYGRINCDPYSGGKPQTTSTYNDALNWKAFAQAADDLDAWVLRDLAGVPSQSLGFLKTFAAWEDLNEAATGGNTPNRLQTGNTAQWPSDFPQTDDGSKRLIAYSMLAGQAFMNFCEALQELARAQEVGAAGATWNGLVGLITDAVKKDTNVDFLRPAALAVMRLCGSSATVVSGPSPTAIPTNHFAVTVTM